VQDAVSTSTINGPEVRDGQKPHNDAGPPDVASFQSSQGNLTEDLIGWSQRQAGDHADDRRSKSSPSSWHSVCPVGGVLRQGLFFQVAQIVSLPDRRDAQQCRLACRWLRLELTGATAPLP